MALNLSGITAAIAALSVSGVTIKDVTLIPQSVVNRDCPMFFPQPGAWSDGGQAASEDETTFGPASDRLWHVHRTLNYVFLHSALGAGRGNADQYSDAVTKTEALMTALVALDVAGVDVEDVSHQPIGQIQDPSGMKFTGCLFSIKVRERINP